MKTLLEAMQSLKEAKPSTLKKTKDRTRDIHYEPSEGDYENVPFDYTLNGGDYSGYITDKDNKRYTISAKIDERDTGRIAGGSTYYNIQIAYGEHKISLSDYDAVFSQNGGSGYKLISDAQDGMYLEDYLQKHINCVTSVSNIEDWEPETQEEGYHNKNKEWVKENIIDGNEYDERTSLQKKIDKKNKKEYVAANSLPVIISNNSIKLVKDTELSKVIYAGKNKFDSTDEDIEVKKGTEVILENGVLEKIINMATTNGKYDFEITLEDLNNVTLIIQSLYRTFQINDNKLKSVSRHFKDMETVEVIYDPSETSVPCKKLDDMISKAKLTQVYKLTLPKLYKELSSRIGGSKDSIVEIVYDYSKKELRAQGDDGTHGKNWVQFPKDLRQQGKKYKVDQLVWNGKNYRAKGNIEEV